MKKVIVFLILALISNSEKCLAQPLNDNIEYIAFRFEHSRRIPLNQVIIEIIKRQTESIVHVRSKPMNNDKQWESSKIDKSFKIDTKVFVDLANEVLLLSKTDLKKAFTAGLDGTECTIEFGIAGSTVAYKFWTPDYDT